MKRRKIISTVLIVLSVFAAFIAVAGLCLMSAIDKNITLIDNAEDYADRGELREEYFGIKTADLEIDDNGHFVMNFTVAGQRRYWRMQEMNNPADNCCDYVDIYFD